MSLLHIALWIIICLKTADAFIELLPNIDLGTLFRGLTVLILGIERQYVLLISFFILWSFLGFSEMNYRLVSGLIFALFASILWCCTNLDTIQDLVLLFGFAVPITMTILFALIKFRRLQEFSENADFIISEFAAVYCFCLFLAMLYFYFSPADTTLLFDRHTVSWEARWDMPTLASFVLQYTVLFFKEDEKESMPFEFVPSAAINQEEDAESGETSAREGGPIRIQIECPCCQMF